MHRGEYMYKELREGPDAVRRTVEEAAEEVRRVAALLSRVREEGVTHGFVIGSGTSFHASLFLQYVINKFTRLKVTAVPASEFKEWKPREGKDYFIIGYSQSGESSDIVEAFEIAKKEGITTVAITNTPGSTLTKISDACIVTRAGEEKAVAATKTFDVQLAAALMLAYELSGRDLAKVADAADQAEKVLEMEPAIRELAERYKDAEHAFALGKDCGYPIALEAALKLKEAAMVHAEGFASREFLHGPVQLVDERTPVLVFVPSTEAAAGSLKALEKIAGYSAPIVIVGPREPSAEKYASAYVEVSAPSPELVPIPLVKVAQLFAYHVSILRGLDPDKQSKLTKVVKY